jgi:hypothetical protein
VRLDLTRQPLVEVEVFPATRQGRHIESELERSKVLEDFVEGFEVLSDVDNASDVHFRFRVEVAESGVEELRIDLVETEEDELMRRVTGEEGREEAGSEFCMESVPRFLRK